MLKNVRSNEINVRKMLNFVKEMTIVSEIFSKKQTTAFVAERFCHSFVCQTSSDMDKDSFWTMDDLMKYGFQPSPDLTSI